MTQALVTLCGSLSLHPVGLGAVLHEAGYRALGLRFVYVPFQVSDVAGALRGMRALGIRGLGVSMPWKREVLSLLDALSPLAERIGAVNTILNDDGRLVGHNTDAEGSLRALEEVTLANRDEAKARALGAQVGADAVSLAALPSTEAFDAVVNATSLGMADVDPRPPLDPARVAARTVLMDIVYKPLQTELVRAVRRRRAQGEGAAVLTGERMLLHQAARQFELYTGAPAPLGPMDEALRSALADDGAPR